MSPQLITGNDINETSNNKVRRKFLLKTKTKGGYDIKSGITIRSAKLQVRFPKFYLKQKNCNWPIEEEE